MEEEVHSPQPPLPARCRARGAPRNLMMGPWLCKAHPQRARVRHVPQAPQPSATSSPALPQEGGWAGAQGETAT